METSQDDLIMLLTLGAVAGFLLAVVAYGIGHRIGALCARREMEDELPRIRRDSVRRSRAALSGQAAEQLAPFLPGFPYSPTEVRFIGKPVDFIAFEGMDRKDIRRIVFVEVKSGSGALSAPERQLRDAVESGRVEWREYRVPEPARRASRKARWVVG